MPGSQLPERLRRLFLRNRLSVASSSSIKATTISPVLGIIGPFQDDVITIMNAGLDHGLAFYLQGVVVVIIGVFGWHLDPITLMLNCSDRHTRRNLAENRQQTRHIGCRRAARNDT